MAKDFMDTQTGGEGETVQLSDKTVNNQEQFVANITAPIVEPTETPIVPPIVTVPTEQEVISQTEQANIPFLEEKPVVENIDTLIKDTSSNLIEGENEDIVDYGVPAEATKPIQTTNEEVDYSVPVSNNQKVVKKPTLVVKPKTKGSQYLSYPDRPDNEYRVVNDYWQKRKKGEDEWYTIQESSSVQALNKYHKTDAKVFRGTYNYVNGVGKESEFEYKRVGEEWYKRPKSGTGKYEKIVKQSSIDALDYQWGVNSTPEKKKKGLEYVVEGLAESDAQLGLPKADVIKKTGVKIEGKKSDVTPLKLTKEQEALQKLAIKEDVSKQIFERNLNLITPDKIDFTEERLVPYLQDKFGKEGFGFIETGGGDEMEVTYNTDPSGLTEGRSIQINLQPFSDEEKLIEHQKLINFMKNTRMSESEKKNLATIDGYEEANKEYQKGLREGNNQSLPYDQSAPLYEKYQEKLIELMAGNPYKYGSELVKKDEYNELVKQKDLDLRILKKNLEWDSNVLGSKLEKFKQNPTEEERIKLSKEVDDLNRRKSDFKDKYDRYETLQRNYQKAIGMSVSEKEKQGDFLGMTLAGISQGFTSIEKMITGATMDVMPAVFGSEATIDSVTRGKLDELGYSEYEKQVYASQELKRFFMPKLEEGITNVMSGGTTTEEYRSSKDRNEFEKVVNMLSESIGAVAGGGGNPALGKLSFYAMSKNAIDKEMRGTDFDGLSENEKLLVSVPYGLTIGALEHLGFKFSTLTAKNPVFNNFIKNVVSKSFAILPKNASIDLIEKVISKETASLLLDKGLKIVGGALVEGATEGVQQIDEVVIKNIANAVTEKDYFKNTPDITTSEGIKQTIGLALQDAKYGFYGGLVMAGGATALNSVKQKFDEKKSNDEFSVFLQNMTDEKLLNASINEINRQVELGDMTKEEGDAQLKAIEEAKKTVSAIPENLSVKKKRIAYDLINERTNLENEIKGKDKNLIENQSERINGINEELKKLANLKIDDTVETQATPSIENIIDKDIEVIDALEIRDEIENQQQNNKQLPTEKPTETKPSVEETISPEVQKQQNQQNAIVRLKSEYNKLSETKKKSKEGVGIMTKISSLAGDLNYTISDNKGKIEIKNDKGKNVVSIKEKTIIPEATAEQFEFARQTIDNGMLNWDGNPETPRIELPNITWSEIRQGEKDLRAGKTNTSPAKKLVNAISEFKDKDDFNFIQGSGGVVNKTSVPTNYKAEENTNIQLTEEEQTILNDEADAKAKEYDEWFSSLDEDTQNQILEEYEGRNQEEIGTDSEGGKSEENDIDAEETIQTTSRSEGIFEKIKSIPKKFKGNEVVRDYTVNPETDVAYKQELREMLSNNEITQDEFDEHTYDIDQAISEFYKATKELSAEQEESEKPFPEEKKEKKSKHEENDDTDPYENGVIFNWEATVRRGDVATFLDWMVERLGNVFENIQVSIDRGAYISNAKRLGKDVDSAGFIDSENGIIYLNPEVANENTAFEEYSHIWIEIAEQKSPTIIEKGLHLISTTEGGKKYIDEVMNDKGYSDIHGNEKAVQKEALAKMIADRGVLLGENIKDNPVKNWLKNFWRSILKGLGIKSDKVDVNKDSLGDLVGKIAKELLQNKPISNIKSEDFVNIGTKDSFIDIQKSMLNPMSSIDNFRVWAKYQTKLGKGSDKQVKEMYTKVKGAIQKMIKGSEFIVRDFQKAVDNYLVDQYIKNNPDKDIATKIKNGTVKLATIVNTKQKRDLLEKLNKALIDPEYRANLLEDSDMSNFIEKPLMEMRNYIDKMSQALLDSGLIDPNSDLYATINGNQGLYLNKSYKVFSTGKYDWRKALDDADRRKAFNWVRQKANSAELVEWKKTKQGNRNVYELTFVNAFGEKSNSVTIVGDKALQNYVDGLKYQNFKSPFVGKVKTMFKGDGGVFEFGSKISMEGTGVNLAIMSDIDVESKLDEMTKSKEDKLSDIFAKKGLTKASADILMKKTERDSEYDMIMGAVIDPIINFSKTVAKQAGYLQKMEMELRMLKDMPFLFSKTSTPTNPIQITASQSKNLAGKWTTPEFYNYMYADGKRRFFKSASNPLDESNIRSTDKYMKPLNYLSSAVKQLFTKYSPASNARNVLGAKLALLKAGGGLGILDYGKRFKTLGDLGQEFSGKQDFIVGTILNSRFTLAMNIAKLVRTKSVGSARELIIELAEQGILDSNIDAGTIKDLTDAYVKEEQKGEISDESFAEGFMDKTKQRLKSIDKSVTDVYQFSDNVPKAILYLKLKETYDKSYGSKFRKEGMSEFQVKEKIKLMAGEAVKNQMPTYEFAPELVKAISRSPFIGSFIMYKYATMRNDGQIIKNIYQLIRDAREMDRDGYKEEASQLKWLITKKVASFAIMQLFSVGLTTAIASMFNFGDDDDEALRKLVPEYRKNNSLLPTAKLEDGVFQYLDMSNIDPQDSWIKILRITKDDGAIAGAESLLDPYFSKDISLGILVNAIQGEDEYGREFAYAENEGLKALQKVTYFLDKTTRSSIIGQSNKMYKAFTGQHSDYEKFTITNELSSWLLGLKTIDMDVEGSFKTKSRSLAYQIEKMNDGLKKSVKEGDMFASEIERGTVQGNVDKFINEAREMVYAMKKLGYSEQKIRTMLEYTKPNTKGKEVQQIPQFIVDKMMGIGGFELDEQGEYVKPESSSGSQRGEFDFSTSFDFNF